MHKVRYLLSLSAIAEADFLQRAGNLLKEWRELVANDESAQIIIAATGSKRKAVSTKIEYRRKVTEIFDRT